MVEAGRERQTGYIHRWFRTFLQNFILVENNTWRNYRFFFKCSPLLATRVSLFYHLYCPVLKCTIFCGCLYIYLWICLDRECPLLSNVWHLFIHLITHKFIRSFNFLMFGGSSYKTPEEKE
jgi:hypothetical protein